MIGNFWYGKSEWAQMVRAYNFTRNKLIPADYPH